MYTRRFRGHDIQIPKDYHGTAFEEKFEEKEEIEENTEAESDDITYDEDTSPLCHTKQDKDDDNCEPYQNELSDPICEECKKGDEQESGGLLSQLGLGNLQLSDLILLLLVVLLMKEQNEDTDLPILLLLLLLS